MSGEVKSLMKVIGDAVIQAGGECDGRVCVPERGLLDTFRVAQAILAAGWRPSARVITDEAQLGKEPLGTVIRDAEDRVARRTRLGDGPAWVAVGFRPAGWPQIVLPAVVLWEPASTEARR